MKCISTPSLNVLWNGNRIEEFNPSRGVRQGDPLSLFIFVLSIEKLSYIISDFVENNIWNPMRINRFGLLISHLMFVDDFFLFSDA